MRTWGWNTGKRSGNSLGLYLVPLTFILLSAACARSARLCSGGSDGKGFAKISDPREEASQKRSVSHLSHFILRRLHSECPGTRKWPYKKGRILKCGGSRRSQLMSDFDA